MRPYGLSVALLVSLCAGQARAQADEVPPSNEVAPAPEPAPVAEPPPAPAETEPPAAPAVAPAAAAPPQQPAPAQLAPPAARAPSSNTPVYILPAPSYARPAPPPENFSPRGSPLYGQNSNSYPNTGYTAPPAQYAQPSYAPPTYVTPQQPVYTLPPLPPGYTYVPAPTTGANQSALSPGDIARREQLYRELYKVESRLDQLQREQIHTGGPITMMIIGYGATLIATGVALSAYDYAEQVERDGDGDWYDSELDANDDGEIDARDENRFRKTARISAAVAAGTLTLGILSTARLVKRVNARRAQRVEMNDLAQQRQNLRQQLDYGAAMLPGQASFTLRGKF